MPGLRLTNQDVLSGLPDVPDASVDLIIFSPPYMEKFGWSEALMKSFGRLLPRVLRTNGRAWMVFGQIRECFDRQFRSRELVADAGLFFGLLPAQSVIWVKSIALDGVTYGHFQPIPGSRFVNFTFEHVFQFVKTDASGTLPQGLDRLSVGVPFMDKGNLNRGTRGKNGDIRCAGDVWFLPDRKIRPSPFESDLRWLALFLDTEGACSISRSPRKDSSPSFQPSISFYNTYRPLLERARDLIGHGVITEREPLPVVQNLGRVQARRTMFRLKYSSRLARDVLVYLYPYLIVKRKQARLAIALADRLEASLDEWKGAGNHMPAEEIAWRDQIHSVSRELNDGHDMDVEWVSEPPSIEGLVEDQGDSWFVPYSTTGIRIKKGHPHAFPAELVRRIIRISNVPSGGVVFDPCCGGGTTLAVARELGLDAWGNDVDPSAVESSRAAWDRADAVARSKEDVRGEA